MAIVKVDLLGSPRFFRNENEIFLSRNKSIAVLAYLACTGQRIYRSDLADIFWPDSDASHSLGSLRTTLAEINTVLGRGILTMVNNSIYISEESIICDVAQFRKNLNVSENLNYMKKRAELWKGGFLKGFSLKNNIRFSDWQFLEEQNILKEYKELLKKISFEFESKHCLEESIRYAHKSLILDVYDERTHRELMRLYAEAGNRTAALKQYKTCIKCIESDLGFPLEDDTVILAEKIDKGILGKRQSEVKEILNTKIGSRLVRLAILPFSTIGTIDYEIPILSDIAGEAMTDYSSALPELEVISRTSALTYKNSNKTISRMAAEMRIDYIIEGQIAVTENEIKIECRLINASRDSIIARKAFSATGRSEITTAAEQVAADLINKLGITSKTKKINESDPGVQWRLYGNSLVRDSETSSMDLAIKSYKRALELNQEDSKAWAGIANALECKCNVGMLGSDTNALYEQAEIAANKALSINPNESLAIYEKGVIAEERDWDYETAKKLYRKAESIDPSNAGVYASLSFLYARLNRLDESRSMAERARELDPVNMWTIGAQFWTYVASGWFRKAQYLLDESKRFFPHPTWNAFDRALMQILIGNYENAIPILEGVKSDMIAEKKDTLLGTLAYAYAKSGMVKEAERLISELRRNKQSFIGLHLPFAAVYTAFGKYTQAIQWLEKAVEARDPGLLSLALLPYYRPLYDLPDYKEILKRVNIIARD